MKNIKLFLLAWACWLGAFHAGAQVTARYVRIQQNHPTNLLNLAEVRAIQTGTGTNLALNKPVSSHSSHQCCTDANLVDGNLTNFAHSGEFGGGPVEFFEIDLGAAYSLSKIEVVNRFDSDRSENLLLILKDGAGTQVFNNQINAYQNQASIFQSNWVLPAGSLHFDGTDDYVSLNSPTLPSTFTLEAWVYPGAGYGIFPDVTEPVEVISRWGLGGTGNAAYRLGINSAGKAVCGVYNGSNGSTVTSTATVPVNTWNHIAATRASDNTLRIYVNGVLSGTASNSVVPQASNYQVHFGKPVVGNNRYKGSIDEARLWNTTHSAEEIQALMNCEGMGNETGLLGLYHFNQSSGTSLADATANANNGVLNNFALTGSTSNWIAAAAVSGACPAGAALAFDGSNDYVNVPTNAAFEFEDGTVEMWVKPTYASLGQEATLACNRQPGGNGTITRWSYHMGPNREKIFAYNGNGVQEWFYTFNQNQWYHIAFVESGSTTEAFINGVSQGTRTIASSTNTGLPLRIGGVGNGAYFQGLIDDVRIWNVVRTPAQILGKMSCELLGTESGLQAYYKANQIFGTTLTDATSNAFNGSLVNFAMTGSSSNWASPGGMATGATCLDLTITGPATACGSATLTATSDGTYLWSNGATTDAITVTNSDTYTVTVTSAGGGSTATASHTVSIFPAASAPSITGASIGCDNLTLTASAATSYAWSSGATTAQAVLTASGAYTVTTTDANGCTATASQTVTVNSATASIAGPSTGCDEATLTASGGIGYSWTGGTAGPVASFSTGGTYMVTVTASNGCTATATHTLFYIDQSKTYYMDADGDGYGDSSNPEFSCTPLAGHLLVGLDCDDSNPAINPGAVENCDNVDNNCNGILIEQSCPGSNAPVSSACSSRSTVEVLKGRVFFNYGSLTNAHSASRRTSLTIGQPVVGVVLGDNLNMGFGFWTRFLLAPSDPVVEASEGDLPDRVQINWSADPLSPAASTYKIYRNGALLATVDNETFAFIDFNVLAGQFYTYEVAGVNQFGEGQRGSSLGFLNPNGVVTGQVKTFSGNPVPGAVVKLTPTIGTAVSFNGLSTVFAEYRPEFPRQQFTLSCWVKQGEGNDNCGIFDLGSSIGKNWWLHTLPASAGGKGVKFGIGKNPATKTEITYSYPAAVADEWHYVAASYNGSALLLYLDGELVGTAVGEIAADSLVLFIGKRSDEGGYFMGKVDEIRFFDRQLPQTEIQMIMNQTVSATTDGLVAYWKFDEGTGSKGFDLSSNKIKAHFCGAEWTSDKPNVVNAGISDVTGFYKIEGVNYSSGTTFTAVPSKDFNFNQSLEFNAANQTYASLTNFDLPDSATIELTVKNFDFSANQALLTKQDGSTTHFALTLVAGNLLLDMGGAAHNFGTLAMGFHRLTFAIKQTGGSAAVDFYQDGAFVGSHTFSGVATDFSGGTPWTLGTKRNGAAFEKYFTGLIDEAVFFSTLLPLADIQAHANIGTKITHPNLYVYFNLNEGEGTDLHDMGTALTGKGLRHGAGWSTVVALSQVLAHEFTPASRLVTLNPSNTSADQIDFTDQSTIPVSGYVRFENTNCFQQKVEILVNGAPHVPQIYTDSDGKFIADFEPGADIVLTPKFEGHTFYPAFWDLPNLGAPVAGILFRNQTKRKVYGQVAGGHCRKSVIPAGAIVKVKVATLNGCYEQVQELPESGKFVFNGVPPDSVTVAIIQHSNPVIYTFFQNLGGATLDLKNQNDTTDFIYFAPPSVELSPLDTNACGDPMLEMAAAVQTTIKVFETYDGGKCYLDSAELTINNGISDLSQFDTVMTTGSFKYKYKAASPNIVSPYLKTLQVTAKAHDELATETLSAVVLGKRARQTTFASTSPEIPTLILRDPPGDASFSFMESGETTCQNWAFATTNALNHEEELTLSLGADLTTSVGLGAEVELELDATADFGFQTSGNTSHMTSNEMETCITTTKVISTSDNDLIVGSEMGGDVYVGGAVNFIFGITDDLKFDTLSCGYVLDKGLVVFPDGFNTTFIYSEYNILNTVIPNLLTIGDTASANRWQGIVDRNTLLKNEAVFVENLSFDAGAVYEQSTTTEVTKAVTNEWVVEFSNGFSSEFGLDINGVGLGAGLSMTWTTTESKTQTNTSATSKTVGFTLSDNDIHDNFTVNVKKDKAYGTPVFDVVSGKSACPWEPNTQPREEVQLSIDHNVEVNVNENDVAIFELTLGNTSPSGENGFYFIEMVPESNPKGATLAANGVDLSGPVLYQVLPNVGLPLTVTIGKGPVDYDYTNLRIAARSGCEFDRAIAIGIPREDIDPKFYKEVLVDVHFLEPCSPVDIGFPLQDWVLTPSMGNDLAITLNGYDTSDPDLELIRVQWRRTQGDGAWINIVDIPAADLGPVFEIVQWSTATLQDGLYEIRAVTQCYSGAFNPGISHVIKGKIERTPPEIFGTPQPSDGVLSADDEISITFTEPIRCDQLIQADFFDNNNVGLYNTRTGDLVDAVITCSGDKIIVVPNVANAFIENEILRVEVDSVQDLASNKFGHASWEFFVDRNPLRWQASQVDEFKYEDEFKTVYKTIVNTGGNSEYYELTDVPAWVEVYPKNGLLAPGQQQAITFEFDSSMVIGAFADTLFMQGALGDEPLPISFRNLCRPPDWQVNPAAWTYSMNFTAQLNIEGEVSTDKQDIVGAFIDGELRGMAYLKYVPVVDKYEAFLTVYSNEFIGGTVEFQIWDASTCLLYGEVVETFPFTSDELVGTPNVPLVLHTNNLLLRKIPLQNGWNWISFNLAFPDNSLDAGLASLVHPQNDLIKNQTAFANYTGAPIDGWLGSLTSLGNTSMYQYRADAADTIVMLGNPIDLSITSIPVSAGWNWISYLPQNPLPVNEALASLVPLNGDVVKSQTAFAQYLSGFGWIGNLEYMQAPLGYLLKLSNPGSLNYPHNFTGGGHPSASERNDGGGNKSPWTVNPTQFEHTMILVGMLSADGGNATREGMAIGAFANGEARGVAEARYVEPLGQWMFFLTVYAKQAGEALTFQLYEAETGTVSNLTEGLQFSIDGQVGLVEAPKPFTLDGALATVSALTGQTKLRVQPNPFTHGTDISFQAAETGQAMVVVVDALGRVRSQFERPVTAGWNRFTWKAEGLPGGVYFLRIGTLTEKIILDR